MRRYLTLLVVVVALFAAGIWTVYVNEEEDNINDSSETNAQSTNASPQLLNAFPEVDFTNTNIDLELIFSGGPGRDGIPALTNPDFESIQDTTIAETTRGILLEINGDKRFYPYNVLVWHEIVNDTIGGQDVAVTFCPLCGSAIVYDRNLDDGVVEFGVSGFLFESNMIMYDRRDDNITFWSQSLAEGIAGERTGQKLETIGFQLLEVVTVKREHLDAKIMTTNTGYSRDYTFYPYGDYDFNEDLIFPTSVSDRRFSAKEIFYIIPTDSESVALRIGELERDEPSTNSELGFVAIQDKDGNVNVQNDAKETLPGYFEMWFSWATHHQDDGIVWDPRN